MGHCFVTFAKSFDIYVTYCKNKPDSNNLLIQPEISTLFDELQKEFNIMHPLAAYLIKPVQRITVSLFLKLSILIINFFFSFQKYQLLLKDLLTCCEQGLGNKNELSFFK